MSRPRIPTAILEAKGSFDRNPALRRKDPETTGELGEAPVHFDADRTAIWHELSALLPLGVARNADRFSFELICDLMYQQRFQGIKSADLNALISLLRSFGLDPASRAKVATPVTTKDDDSNPFNRFKT
jgi:phage terminase small subunit